MNKKSHIIIWEVAGVTEKDYLQDCVCVCVCSALPTWVKIKSDAPNLGAAK